jgi:hypothetical protein
MMYGLRRGGGSSYKHRRKGNHICECVVLSLRGSVSTKSVRGNPGLATIQTKGVKVVIVTIMYTTITMMEK